MRKRLCSVALVILNAMGSNFLLACGDKFVGSARGTRFQQAPIGHQETILIYVNPASDVPTALARVSVVATLRRAGYRPTTVTAAAEFESELNHGGWDLVLVGLADAQAVRQRENNKTSILPVTLNTTGAQLQQTRKEYPVVLTRAPSTNDSFIHVIYDALAYRFKSKAA